MSTEPENTETPVAAEGVLAEQFIVAELKKAKDGLLKTQIIAVVAVLLVGGYLGYVTNTFTTNLEPKTLGNTIKSYVVAQVDEQAPQIQDYVRKEVPAYVAKLPDLAKEQLPKFREELEGRLLAQVEAYADQSNEKLGNAVDTFLENNKDSVKALIENGQDPAATKAITAELKKVFVEYLEETAIEGETLKQKLDASLEALSTLDARVQKLAANKGLTASEKKARRAIAVLAKTVDTADIEKANLPKLKP